MSVGKRQVQALVELKKDAVVQEAGLQDEEILALVLYTGWSLTHSFAIPVLRCCWEHLTEVVLGEFMQCAESVLPQFRRTMH